MKDMTKGNPTKLIIAFSVPMLIGNVLQQFYNIADSIIVGQGIGKQALAAVGNCFPIIFLLVALVIGLGMGATVLLSQYMGAKDFERVRRTVNTAYFLLIVSSVILTIIGISTASFVLKFLHTPQEVYDMSIVYIIIIYIGIFPLSGYNSVSAILNGLGDSKRPLYFLILASAINIILAILFVFIFKFGIAGAAWATVIAQGVSFVVALMYLNKNHPLLKFRIKELRVDKEILGQILKIGIPTGVQQLVYGLGIFIMQWLINTKGTDVITGYTAASRVESFAIMPLMTFGMAISTYVGQNIGANRIDRVKKGFSSTLKMALSISVAVSLILVFFAKQIILLFITGKETDVVAFGMQYIHVVAPFYIAIAVIFVITGVLRGAGDTLMPTVISFVALLAIRIPISYLLAFKLTNVRLGHMELSTVGIWGGTPIGWIVGAIIAIIYYNTGKWKSKAVTNGMYKEEPNLLEIEKEIESELQSEK